MREFVRTLVATLSIACLAASFAVISSHGALAQAKGGPAPQGAPMQPPPFKQIALTDKQIEGVIAASRDMDAITEKLPENAAPDPKVMAQLDAVAKKNGFAGFDEYNNVVDNISIVMAGFDPATAGGLMSPEFVCVYDTATCTEALDRVRRSRASADTVAWVYVMSRSRRLRCAIPLADLLRADPAAEIGDAATFMPPTVRPDADVEELARLMTDFDLTVVPVVDEREQLLGVVTVDDVLEMVLPRGWRRRFEVFGGD